MNRLKNIILVIALLLVAMPCTHAAEHHHVLPFSGLPDQMSAVHACECHSCDEGSVCTEPLEVIQERFVSSVTTAMPVSAKPLFVLNQYRLTYRQPSPPVTSALTGLKTVQLLI